jgi:hypothetical protein
MRNKIILIVGFRGSGKTTVASNILRAQDAVFVFDPHVDEAYRWVPNTARNEKQLTNYPKWATLARPNRVACRFVPDGRQDPYDALEFFCSVIWTCRNLWMCVEEVSESCKGVSAQGMPPELRRIVNQGRHKGLNQIYCGLRYAEIPRSISAGADVQILFRCQEPLDLDSMRGRIGCEATERVQGLGPHEALIFLPDRSWRVVGSRDARIADLVMRDGANGANVSADEKEEREEENDPRGVSASRGADDLC